MKKVSQDSSSLIYNPQLGAISVGDLYAAIRADAGLSTAQKMELITRLKSMAGYMSESSPISALMAKGLGAVIGGLVAKYFGLGLVGQVVSAIGGFGLGTSLYNKMTQPKNPFPGYRSLG